MKTKKQQIVEVDVDESYSVGTEQDAVYFNVGKSGNRWYMSAIIDCDSAGFVDSLCKDDGPYKTEDEAAMAGLNCAIEWMANNNLSDYEVDSRLKPLMEAK